MQNDLRALIAQSCRVVFFGGAGVSTESGIPDFRGENGLYRQKFAYPPEVILSHSFFMRHTEAFFDFYRQRMLCPGAQPSRAHRILADMDRAGKLTGIVNKTNCTCIFINQLREKVGVMYGNPETTPGGRALKFYSSVRLDVRKIDTLKQGQEIIGNRARIKVVKNKVAPPFKQAEFDIMYGEGVSKLSSIIDMGVELEIVDKSGAWFSYNGTRLGQGKENAKQSLRDQPAICEEIEAKIAEALKENE